MLLGTRARGKRGGGGANQPSFRWLTALLLRFYTSTPVQTGTGTLYPIAFRPRIRPCVPAEMAGFIVIVVATEDMNRV